AVQVLPLANPIRVAEEAAIVDHLSEGRLVFGVGRSSFLEVYEGYNVDYAESRALFLESLDVILKAWRHETFSHDGKYYHFHDVQLGAQALSDAAPTRPRCGREPRDVRARRKARLPDLHPPSDGHPGAARSLEAIRSRAPRRGVRRAE